METNAAPINDFPPLQLEISTPLPPTSFPSLSRTHLLYELYLQNFESRHIYVRTIVVLDADSVGANPIAELRMDQVKIQPVGEWSHHQLADGKYRLASGQRIVAFIMLSFDSAALVPSKLRHRICLEAHEIDGPVVCISQIAVRVIGPPVLGEGWLAASGPGNCSHHRTGLLVVNGVAQISRRYAIDWKKTKNLLSFSGDARDVRSYFTHGENVVAVADGAVVVAIDDLPDNIPRTAASFDTALPITMETVAGNCIVIDIGNGQFACYAHLLARSLRVKTGDRVTRGQQIGQIGNSGDAREPHLHFQVTTAPSMLGAEGLPYVIDQYHVHVPGQGLVARKRELPMLGMLVDFGRTTP